MANAAGKAEEAPSLGRNLNTSQSGLIHTGIVYRSQVLETPTIQSSICIHMMKVQAKTFTVPLVSDAVFSYRLRNYFLEETAWHIWQPWCHMFHRVSYLSYAYYRTCISLNMGRCETKGTQNNWSTSEARSREIDECKSVMAREWSNPGPSVYIDKATSNETILERTREKLRFFFFKRKE